MAVIQRTWKGLQPLGGGQARAVLVIVTDDKGTFTLNPIVPAEATWTDIKTALRREAIALGLMAPPAPPPDPPPAAETTVPNLDPPAPSTPTPPSADDVALESWLRRFGRLQSAKTMVAAGVVSQAEVDAAAPGLVSGLHDDFIGMGGALKVRVLDAL